MMYGNTDYSTSSFISSPSEASHNTQEGLVNIDSGDEFGEDQGFRARISQAYEASQHEVQLQTAASQNPYAPTSTDLEERLAALPWSNQLENTHSAGNSLGNWILLPRSQPSAGILDFTTESYNDQLASRDPGGYLGQGVGSSEACSFDVLDEEYPAAIRQQFRTKPGEHYMGPNVSPMDSLKETQVVSSNKKEIQTANRGLLSPTVSIFKQSVQSDMAVPTLGTFWEKKLKNHYAANNASDLTQQIQFDVTPELLLNIVDISPDWSYAFEKTKVLVICVFLESARNYSSTRWSCKFGEIEVPAEVLQPGILRCTTPPHAPGRVSFCVTRNDGVSCSNLKEFEFREKSFLHSSDVSSISGRKLAVDKQRDQQEQAMLLEIRLAKYLLTEEDQASAQESFSDLASSKKLDLLVIDDNCWNWIESLVRRDQHPYTDAKVMLGEAFFKTALHRRLQRKSLKESVNRLDKHGLGVLHMAAALGYEWAITPLLAAGASLNFRDERGWTALHWAASYGREKVIALLLAAGASPGALTDPTPGDPTGRTASDLAASRGHDGIAGYLGEAIVTSHLMSLNLKEMSKHYVAMARDRVIEVMSERSTIVDGSLGVTNDDLSLRDSLAAVRNATQAEACITATFRAYSFQRKREKEDSLLNEFGVLEEEAQAFAAGQSICRGHSTFEKSNLAATQIQCKYRGWRVRSDFLSLRKLVVRIQGANAMAHVRGHQARKKYKKILWTVSVLDKVILRWRRKGSGLRGFKADGEENVDSDDDSYLKDFRKQKEAAFGDAVCRVKQMIQNPEARSQYRRMLEIYEKEKGAQADEDLVLDDELIGLLG